MNILILNRRDIANPAGGGAEIYTHEIAAGLVKRHGCEVVVLSSRFQKSVPEEVIDEVRYIRKGNEATVHLWGFLYAARYRAHFDHIVDEFNGIGFFTFFLSNSVLLIHQLYREFWFREFRLAGVFPYAVEPLILRLYRRRKVITVSPSTRDDLEQRGFRGVKIVMNAIRRPAGVSGAKDSEPTIVFLGRLRRTKRPEDAFRIFNEVKKRVMPARLWIIGAGPLEGSLKELTGKSRDVTFWGRVSEEMKYSLLGRAHVLVIPSVREGFGVNVIEAASVGTPAVGYQTAGLRDSIRHGETGYLVRSPDEAAARIIELLEDDLVYQRLSRNCLEYAEDFDWDKSVDMFREVMESSG